MPVSDEQLQKIAKLARLDLSSEECAEFKGDLNKIIDSMSKLNELDLSEVEPMMRVDDSIRPLRKDVSHPGISSTDTFKNAPAVNEGHFSIPKTVK
ncbi:MAG: Asp-tRNA(Asn)/Glu-tRNA(Gln) amidotransferase subunit GatC [Fibrobacteria bacterium]|nr:Asp-tRNA(Asn)/Glu-tRNA(Gln) amidotransferase subunit GatC [Fibrobacteria bacterium]